MVRVGWGGFGWASWLCIVRCFFLDEQGPTTLRVNLLKYLARVMQMSPATEATLAGEFVKLYPVALSKKNAEELSDLEAWLGVALVPASTVLPGSEGTALPGAGTVLPGPLPQILRIVRSFLLTETECERDFARERQLCSNRPALSPESRFAGLKVMLDGLPLEKLVDERSARPVGPFWSRVQDRYAERYGTKCLQGLTPRCDIGKKKGEGLRKRGGRETITAFKAKRARLQQGGGGSTLPSGRNVFGCTLSKDENQVEGEPTETYERHKVKAQERYEKKKGAVEALLLRQTAARLAEPTAQQRQSALQKRKATLEASLDPRWTPSNKLSARQFVRHCGGIPSFFFWEGAARPEDGIYYNTTTFQECTCPSLAEFIRLGASQPRRILIVKDVGNVPLDATFLAILLGARVQQCVWTPGLHFEPLRAHNIATTRAFRRSFRRATTVAQVFSTLPRSPLSHLAEEAQDAEVALTLRSRPQAQVWKTRTTLVSDEEGGNNEPQQLRKTLKVFLAMFGQQVDRSQRIKS